VLPDVNVSEGRLIKYPSADSSRISTGNEPSPMSCDSSSTSWYLVEPFENDTVLSEEKTPGRTSTLIEALGDFIDIEYPMDLAKSRASPAGICSLQEVWSGLRRPEIVDRFHAVRVAKASTVERMATLQAMCSRYRTDHPAGARIGTGDHARQVAPELRLLCLNSADAGPVPWAKLLLRVFVADVLACPCGGGRRRLLAVVVDSAIARTLLAELGLPSTR
jgi:hypothetical protein